MASTASCTVPFAPTTMVGTSGYWLAARATMLASAMAPSSCEAKTAAHGGASFGAARASGDEEGRGNGKAGMDLKIHEVARLLQVDGDEVARWIREKGLPAHELHDQFHINSVELQEWALAHGVRFPPGLMAVNRAAAGPAADLVAALERGGMHRDVAGTNRDEVLAEVVKLPGVPAAIDRGLLLELLRAREMLASTGLGGGIAVPHPRSPIVLDVAAPPTMLLCFLRQPVDFGAIDGRPVW